jgi:transcriptional regulator with XRE-family HTH domain
VQENVDVRRRFGARIRELRHALGLSQEELAFRAGLHWTYVSSTERGKRNVSLVNIEKLALALNVKPSELL